MSEVIGIENYFKVFIFGSYLSQDLSCAVSGKVIFDDKFIIILRKLCQLRFASLVKKRNIIDFIPAVGDNTDDFSGHFQSLC
jgi:hypothetical protein